MARITRQSDKDAIAALQVPPTAEDNAYSGSSSFQSRSDDLYLDPIAGNVGTNPKFLAAYMGNVFGAALAKAGAYIAGVIGAYSVTDTGAAEFGKSAVNGIIMDGSTDADAIVLATIDGSDPSAETRANAAFGVKMNNNHASSGVDYGVDLKADANANYSGTGKPFTINKALLRGPNDFCLMSDAGNPVDGTTGDNFAGKGSLYINVTDGSVWSNTGTISSPAWEQLALVP